VFKIIDYKGPKTGEVIERPKGEVWAIVKWHNGLTQTLKYNDLRRQFKGKNRYEIKEK
jgi:hypothetical protein